MAVPEEALALVAVDWQHFRLAISIIAGTVLLFFGLRWEDAATMTVGAGLIGFSPAAKGP